MVYRIHRKTTLPISIEEAWKFFSCPGNLRVLTPDWLDLRLTSEVPEQIYAGMIITYQVHPLLGIPMTWVTEITQMQEPFLFVDEQRYGPYRMWHHQHLLRESTGGVEVEDIVDYIMPLGILGKMMHSISVRNKLQRIFDYREKVLLARFSGE